MPKTSTVPEPTVRRPRLEDVRAAIGGDDALLPTRRRSGHDHFDAVIGADTLLGIVEQVWDQVSAAAWTDRVAEPVDVLDAAGKTLRGVWRDAVSVTLVMDDGSAYQLHPTGMGS